MPYAPSIWRVQKYSKYFLYLQEYLDRGDYRALTDSLMYVLFKKLPKNNRIVQTPMGTFNLRKNTTDFQFVNWSYEIELKQHLLSIYHKMGLFIDVGACIGEYCMWMGGRGVRCVAIEPVNSAAIEGNLAFNNEAEDNVLLFNCAVGKENKRVKFNILEGVTSSSHISDVGDWEIQCRTLDSLIDPELIDPDKITFIKLDVEGAELDVLEGAKRFIIDTPNLQIGYEHTSCGDGNIREFLDRYGQFEYRDLDGVNTLAIKKQPF